VTAISTIKAAIPHEPFQAATRDVNEWRGHCLHHFSSVEKIATECLIILWEDLAAKLPQLVGERYKQLAKRLDALDNLPRERSRVVEALASFREMDSLRSMLCHASADVTLDDKGNWTAVFRHVSLKTGRPVCEVKVVTCEEARENLKELGQRANRLRSHLKGFKSALERASR
jgi:hypothetical protein